MTHRFARMPYSLGTGSVQGGISLFLNGRRTRIEYNQLEEHISKTQAALGALNLGPGSVIGIAGPNSLNWVIADLAASVLGIITVAIPEAEIKSTNPDAFARAFELNLLLASADCDLPEREWIASLDDLGALGDACPMKPPPGEIAQLAQDTDLATIIFSSGSSGTLKAIALSRSGVKSVLDAFVTAYKIGPADRLFVAFPMSIFQQRVLTYSALRAGAEISFTEPRRLFHGLAATAPTVVLAPPSLFEAFAMRRLSRTALKKALGGNVRLILTGSAPCPPTTLSYYNDLGMPLLQIYGMAEAGFICFNLPQDNRPGSVGRPVFDGSVSIAEDGEVLVKLPNRQAITYIGVARAQAAEVFRPDGCLATGDIGTFDAQGYLTLTGRKKNIVITSSGRKLSVEPVEAMLSAQPSVSHALVLGGEGLPWLAAIISLDPGMTEAETGNAQTAIKDAIATHNNAAAPDAQVGKTIFTQSPFTAENGLLTRNMKLDRIAIRRRFEAEL